MNKRDRSPSEGFALSDGSGNLRFIAPLDARPAGQEALGLQGGRCRGQAGWPKLLFATGSVEVMEGGLFLACGC